MKAQSDNESVQCQGAKRKVQRKGMDYMSSWEEQIVFTHNVRQSVLGRGTKTKKNGLILQRNENYGFLHLKMSVQMLIFST